MGKKNNRKIDAAIIGLLILLVLQWAVWFALDQNQPDSPFLSSDETGPMEIPTLWSRGGARGERSALIQTIAEGGEERISSYQALCRQTAENGRDLVQHPLSYAALCATIGDIPSAEIFFGNAPPPDQDNDREEWSDAAAALALAYLKQARAADKDEEEREKAERRAFELYERTRREDPDAFPPQQLKAARALIDSRLLAKDWVGALRLFGEIVRAPQESSFYERGMCGGKIMSALLDAGETGKALGVYAMLKEVGQDPRAPLLVAAQTTRLVETLAETRPQEAADLYAALYSTPQDSTFSGMLAQTGINIVRIFIERNDMEQAVSVCMKMTGLPDDKPSLAARSVVALATMRAQVYANRPAQAEETYKRCFPTLDDKGRTRQVGDALRYQEIQTLSTLLKAYKAAGDKSGERRAMGLFAAFERYAPSHLRAYAIETRQRGGDGAAAAGTETPPAPQETPDQTGEKYRQY